MKYHEKLVDTLIEKRIQILIIIALITTFFGYHTFNLEVDNNPAHSLPDSLQQKMDIVTIREKFDSPYTILFLAELHEGTLSEKLATLDSWEKQFSNVMVTAPGDTVEVPGFSNVTSLSGISVPVKGGMFGIKTQSLLDEDLTEAELQELIIENSDLTSRLVSEDQTTFLMILYTDDDVDRQETIGKAVALVDQFHDDGFENTYITGSTAIAWYLNAGMSRDFARLLPIAVLLSMIMLYIIFRRFSFVIAPLIVIAIAITWTFGFMSLLGVKFSVLTGVIPLILFPVGLADSIHVLKCYLNHRREDKEYRESFILSFEELLKPILLTSVTTFFGFASFALSPLEWTQVFGIFTGIAVMLALLLTVILLPILIASDAKTRVHSHKEISIMPVRAMNRFIFKSPGAVIFLLIIMGFAIYFLPRQQYENNPISFFNSDHDVVVSDSIIGETFGGSRFFDLLIEVDESSDLTIDDSLRWSEIAEITSMVEANDNIGSANSLLPIINRVSSLISKDDNPLSNSTISMFTGKKGIFGRESFATIIDAGITEDHRAIKLSLTCKNVPKFNYIGLAEELKKEIETKYPHYVVTAAGQALMIDAGVELLTETQVNSLTLTFITVGLILIILYRNIRVGLFTTFPIVVATLFVAALMASLGVSINSITVIIINSSVGIGIDYAIHFTAGFLRVRDFNEHPSTRDAILHAIHDKGTVIVFNTLAVGLGFLVLNFSGFPPVRDLGLFIFLSMTISSIFALIFLPLLLQFIKPRT